MPRWRHLSADVRCARSVLERTAQIPDFVSALDARA
jgi:hypothetical protein